MLKPQPQSFGPATLMLMGRVCDDAFDKLRSTISFQHPADEQEARSQIARRVMCAVAAGERDPQRLIAIALECIDG
jgi:hypothetical protein